MDWSSVPILDLRDLVDSASTEKLAAFLASIDEKGYAINWEINYPVKDTVRALFTSGLRFGDQNLILITPYREVTRNLLDVSLNQEPDLKASLDGLERDMLSSAEMAGDPRSKYHGRGHQNQQ